MNASSPSINKTGCVIIFKQYLRQHITPILINPDTDLVQFLKDDYTYLAVEIIRGDTIRYALLEIPSDKVPRFVNLPPEAPRRRKADDSSG